MLCGVTATLGSNPSATATAARPQWGRAVLLCLDGVGACACVLVAPRVFLALLVCLGLKDKKSWSEPDLSALRCEKVWFKVVGGQL